MTSKIKKFLSDPVAMLLVKMHECKDSLIRFCSSCITSILAVVKGVKIRGSIQCWGIPYFQRVPSSTIAIGESCTIRSSYKSNNIGCGVRSRITTNAPGARIEIGDHVGMSSVTISSFQHIIIGTDTLIGGNVLITDSDWHPLSPDLRHDKTHIKTAPVHIGNNVFIGTRSIILKGTVIGDNSVIGAGSVVCGTIPPNVIAAGNPCRVIRNLAKS